MSIGKVAEEKIRSACQCGNLHFSQRVYNYWGKRLSVVFALVSVFALILVFVR